MKKTVISGTLLLLLIAGSVFAAESGMRHRFMESSCGGTVDCSTDRMPMDRDFAGHGSMNNMNVQATQDNMPHDGTNQNGHGGHDHSGQNASQ